MLRYTLPALALIACTGDDPTPDDPSTTPTEPIEDPVTVVDADGDGVPAETDCDDSDATVFPGADELCDGTDNDCNDLVDDEPIDGDYFYADTDGDGYGDALSSVLACEAPTGHVDNPADCNDASDQASPSGVEVCDGIDNDCDGTTDDNSVPLHHATIQQAIDELQDGDEICVAAGTWSEPFDLAGRQLTLTGAGGPEVTFLDVSAATPLVSAVDGSEAVLRGFAVTGDADFVDGAALGGAFLDVRGGDVTLEDVVFDANVLTLADSAGEVWGGLITVIDGDLSLTDVEVRDLSVVGLSSKSPTSSTAFGAFLAADSSIVQVEGLTVSDLAVAFDPDNGQCAWLGTLMRVEGGELTASAVEVQDASYDVTCQTIILDGALFSVTDATVALSDWSIIEPTATLTAANTAIQQGMVALYGTTGSVNDMAFMGGTHTLDTSGFGLVLGGGLIIGDSRDLEVEHLTLHGIDVSLPRGAAIVVGAGLYAYGSADFRWLDVRGNIADGNSVSGGAIYLSGEGTISMENAIIAGNEAGRSTASYVSGAGLYTSMYGSGRVQLQNVDVVGNLALAQDQVEGGGMYLLGPADSVVASNINVVANSVSGKSVSGSGLQMAGGVDGGLSTSNVFGNLGASDLGGATTDLLALEGNLVEQPDFTDVLDADPMLWDLTLQAGSALIDAGDPALLDADGSACDIGAFGGPNGAGW